MSGALFRYLETPIEWAFSRADNTVEISFAYYIFSLQSISAMLIPRSVLVWLHKFAQNILIAILSVGPIPAHVSFIMDGNRRYAKSKDMPLKKGHEAGGLTLLTLVYICKRLGVKCVSAYAFSIENFRRPKDEVDTLLDLFDSKLMEFANRAKDFRDPLYGSKIKIIGDKSLLSNELRKKIHDVEKITKDGTEFTFYICFPYTSRNDISNTITSNINNYVNKKIKLKDINVKNFTRKMYLDDYSDKCDILIRTSGHRRLSDFMLWQSHENSTIEFTNTLWPDFSFIKMYLIFLRWSFYTTLQIHNDNYYEFNKPMYSKIYPFNSQKAVQLESFPEPPIAVSVIG